MGNTMRDRRKQLRLLIVCSLNLLLAGVLFARSKPIAAPSVQDALVRPVFTDGERSFTTPEAFHASLNRTRVPGGMVILSGCREDPLQQRAEMKAAMANAELKGALAIITYSPSPTEFSVQFKGGTLRQALNAIAVSNGHDVWDYREFHCGERNEVMIRF